MCVFDGYVYLTICEQSLPMLKKTDYSTYGAFCRGMGYSMRHKKLSAREKYDVWEIFFHLKKIFYMSDEETFEYITNYFTMDMYEDFELSVRYTNECFPFIGG